MMNPVKRFKEWKAYKDSLKAMRKLVELQQEIQPDEDGGLSGENKKLFDFYAMSFAVHSMKAMEYQNKYFKR